MFFWMMLASLMGVVMYGNLYEKTKPQENFIVPVYQSMVLNMYQQHSAAEHGYIDAMNNNRAGTEAFLRSAADGITPLAVSNNGTISGEISGNIIFPYIQARLPTTYKPQNGTRTYMFCVDKNQVSDVSCGSSVAVRYIATIRAIPPRYDGADKMTALRAISDATGQSRFVGMLQKDWQPLVANMNPAVGAITQHQPLGAAYYIMSAGVAPVNSVYVPNYIVCNFPLNNDPTHSAALGTMTSLNGYLVALSLMGGLEHGENLTAGTPNICNAVMFN